MNFYFQVKINGQTKNLSSAFSYDPNLGPNIFSIFPNAPLSGIETTEITIHGNRFGIGAPLIRIVNTEQECQYKSHNETHIVCTLHSLGHFTGYIQVVVDGVGSSNKTSELAKILSVLRITSVSPDIGSLFGKTQIKINGTNFGSDPRKVKVQLGAADCIVDDAINSMITCTTTSPSRVVELRNNGKHAGERRSKFFLIRFLDNFND